MFGDTYTQWYYEFKNFWRSTTKNQLKLEALLNENSCSLEVEALSSECTLTEQKEASCPSIDSEQNSFGKKSQMWT